MKYEVLQVKYDNYGKESSLYPALLHEGNELLLVDAGYPGFLTSIEKAANDVGYSLSQLTGIVVTHHDIDHVGGVAVIKRKYPAVKIYATEFERDYIEGWKKSLRLEQAEKKFDSLSEEEKPWALSFQERLKKIEPVDVDVLISEENGIPGFPDVELIHTPGHMPGHISLYLRDSKTLIAADALVVEKGSLNLANPQYTMNMDDAINSVKKLEHYDINRIICYHGGVIDSDVPLQLERLVAKYSDSQIYL
jgi:glyoxylase-like metal-dependent hydrolase (beta-lactamase superfamily II)